MLGPQDWSASAHMLQSWVAHFPLTQHQCKDYSRTGFQHTLHTRRETPNAHPDTDTQTRTHIDWLTDWPLWVSGPRIAGGKIMDTRLFLRSGLVLPFLSFSLHVKRSPRIQDALPWASFEAILALKLILFSEVIFKDPPKIPFKTSTKITSRGYYHYFWDFPIFPGFSRFARGWSGDFPDLSFSSFSAY